MPAPRPGTGRIGLAFITLLALVPWVPGVAEAGDPAVGKKKAWNCRFCHGIDGLSRRPDAPHIAGQSPIYMRAQLLNFRSGRRKHQVMNIVAKTLSDADIDDLVAYYSSIKITVEVPK
jgi:cytochrome c553